MSQERERFQKSCKGNRLGCRAGILLSEKKPFVVSYHQRQLCVNIVIMGIGSSLAMDIIPEVHIKILHMK